MRSRWRVLAAAAFGLTAWGVSTGCQSYDFEPVKPLVITQTTITDQVIARDRKPNVMLLVDTSSSMRLPIDTTSLACQYGDAGTCGEPGHSDCNPATCPSRWSDLQSSITDFLEGDAGTLARYGLSTFPGPGTLPNTNIECVPTETVTVGIPAADRDEDNTGLMTRAASVATALDAIKYSDPNPAVAQTHGGTPTGGSLSFLGRAGDLRDEQRNNFVLLLTDGLPNCNPVNVNSEEDNPGACVCTLEGGNGCFGDTARIGCLDGDATIATLTDLAGSGHNIRTVVVGFGAETGATSAQATLNSMAEAGGLARNCLNGATCDPSENCDPVSHLCDRRYYQANNGAELATVLDDISKRLSTKDPCLFALFAENYPDSPDLLTVSLNGRLLAAGPDTWSLVPAGVQFAGSACTEIKASTPDAPAVIEVHSIQLD